MKVRLWGTRGSIPTPGPETTRYGGNTSCVEVRGDDGALLILDAGTGIRRLGAEVEAEPQRVDLLLTHLHMDHIQGLGFFDPLFDEDREVHIWGPSSATLDLRARLSRYLSPPLFPVHLSNVPCDLELHDVVSIGQFRVGRFDVRAELVCHPAPTVGYRIAGGGCVLAYLPDHEPALGADHVPTDPEWCSGFDLAADADLLIHDAQFGPDEYPERVGWGHSAILHALEFGVTARVKHLVPFHHDPAHSDAELEHLFERALTAREWPFSVTPGVEGATFNLAAEP